jgi:hypothetical protein
LTRPGAGIENREATVDGAAVGGTAWIDEVQVWKVK